MDGFYEGFPYAPAFQAFDLATDHDIQATLGIHWPTTEDWDITTGHTTIFASQVQLTNMLTTEHPVECTLPTENASKATESHVIKKEMFHQDTIAREGPAEAMAYQTNTDVDGPAEVPQQDAGVKLQNVNEEKGEGSTLDLPPSLPEAMAKFYQSQGLDMGTEPNFTGHNVSFVYTDQNDAALKSTTRQATAWANRVGGLGESGPRQPIEFSASAPDLTDFRHHGFLRPSMASRKSQAINPEPLSMVKVETSDVSMSTKFGNSQGELKQYSLQRPPKVSRSFSDRVPVEGIGVGVGVEFGVDTRSIPGARCLSIPVESDDLRELAKSIQHQVAEAKFRCPGAMNPFVANPGAMNSDGSLPQIGNTPACAKVEKQGGEVKQAGKPGSRKGTALSQRQSTGGTMPSQQSGDVEGRTKTLTADQHRFLDQFLESIISDSVERTEQRHRESLHSYHRQNQLRAAVMPYRPGSGDGPNRGWQAPLR